MMLLRSRILIPVVALATLGTSALAHAKQAASIAVHHAWARETAAGQSVGGGFMTITNRTPAGDRLLTGSSPVAAEVQLHTMTMDGGVMRMRQVEDGISIPANGTLELKPGSYHIMFMGLKRQLRQGERFLETDPLILLLNRRGRADLTIPFPNAYRNMGDLPATFLTALDAAAQVLEGLNEEALDVVRLKPQRFGPLHVEAQFLDLGFRHRVVGERPAAKQFEQMPLIDCTIYLSEQTGLDLLLLAVLDRLEQQVLQRRAFE